MARRVPGFRAAGICCGLKQSGALDVAVIASDRPTAAAALFTRNKFPGAPVIVSREHMRRGRARAVVVNSGAANVATGAAGVRDARRMAAVTAEALSLRPVDVQVASTGVIGPRLPIDRIENGIRDAVRCASADGWSRAARAILTTDTRPKLAFTKTRAFSLLGIAKGSGMISPDMATMLVFIATDLAVEPALIRRALREAVDPSLNRLSIDGQTSTSDTVLLLANGAAGNRPLGPRSPGVASFRNALRALCDELAEKLAADGEGVTRVAEIQVTGARSSAQATRAARGVADSLLVKTALFGGDPNWGRIVQAVGAAGVDLRCDRLGVRIGGVDLLRGGVSIRGRSVAARAARAMRGRRVTIQVSLGVGRGRASIRTTDLSYEYVRINAEYTT